MPTLSLNPWYEFLRFCSGAGVLLALMYSWAFAFPLAGELQRLAHKDDYQPAVFEVVDAVYYETDADFWLVGTIDGSQERFIPAMRPRPANKNDILNRFPVGSKLDVFYNRQAGEAIGDITVSRVIEWKSPELMRRMILNSTGPLAIAIALFVCVRIATRSAANPRESTGRR